MTVTQSPTSKTIEYPQQTVIRADRALRCAPFTLKLFITMLEQSVNLGSIAGVEGVQKGYTKQPQSEIKAESWLMWLIEVGLLRREVDGQGLTDSFRLTPLGRQLTEKWQNLGSAWPAPSWLDRLKNALTRWLRLPV